ncbi:hypothetical protein TrLO_g1275 [Triparma laevis f. longispina]|uniref:Uncharacterized protein n=1 Tax=Triparma laevis f. longispina TaxID=1714387 RepID=A0A9W7FC75_9STRA|nr:hypothetical protein TrLO_g1275 [Triparma laevis f. longispina]
MRLSLVLLTLTSASSLPWLEDAQQRSLQEGLDCTPYEADEPDSFGVYEANEDLDMTALDSLKDFRGEGGPWYEEVLDSMMIANCNENTDKHERYVDCEEESADQEEQAGDFDGGGLCEVNPNCYWDKIDGGDRQRMYTDEEADAAKKKVEEYAVSVGKYLGAPIACAVLNFVFTLFYFLGRCICRIRCCGAKPRETPYHSCEILLPILFFSVFAFAMVGTGYQANQGNEKVTIAFERIFETVDRGTTDLMFFFGTAGRPIEGVADAVSGAVAEVNTIVDASDWVGTDMDGIGQRFVTFSTTYAATLSAAGASDTLDDVIATLDETTGPIVEEIDGLLTTLQTELVNVEDMIQEGAQGALDQIQAMNDTVAGMKSDLKSFQDTQESFDGLRQVGVLAIFAVALVFVILGFIGVLSAFTPCKFDDYLEYLLHFTWTFGSLIGTITFIVGGIALVLAIGWSDMCTFMNVVKEDFSIIGGQAGTGLDACYNDTALIYAFNMSKSLDFAGPIEEQLASVTGMDISEQFGAIKQPIIDLGVTITAISLADLFAALNAMTNACEAIVAGGGNCDVATCGYSQTYTEANVLSPWEDNGDTGTMVHSGHSLARAGSETAVQYMTRIYDSSACATATSDAASPENIMAAFNGAYDTQIAKDSMLADLGTDATFCASNTCPTSNQPGGVTIMQALEDYEANMVGLIDDFVDMGDNMLGALISNVEDFTCNMRCGFLASFMDELQANWCVDLLAGFLDIALSLVLLAFFNIPVCICAAILVNRFRGKWRVSCGAKVFAGADEGGRSIGKGNYDDEKGEGETTDAPAKEGTGEVEMQTQQSGTELE